MVCIVLLLLLISVCHRFLHCRTLTFTLARLSCNKPADEMTMRKTDRHTDRQRERERQSGELTRIVVRWATSQFHYKWRCYAVFSCVDDGCRRYDVDCRVLLTNIRCRHSGFTATTRILTVTTSQLAICPPWQQSDPFLSQLHSRVISCRLTLNGSPPSPPSRNISRPICLWLHIPVRLPRPSFNYHLFTTVVFILISVAFFKLY